jgi:inosose dehydratase
MKVANAPVSWGVFELTDPQDRPDYGLVLDEIRQAGYQGTELGDWGFLPTDPERLAAELSARELELVAAFVPVALAHPWEHANGESNALRVARLLQDVSGDGALLILSDDNGRDELRSQHAGRIGPEHGLSPAQWKSFVEGAQRIARAVREATGLRTAFHHHCAGYVETAAELGALMERSDPQLLGLCLDTGHLAFGGGDPAVAVGKYRQRIWHVHFKDVDPRVAARSREEGWDYPRSVREGLFCRLGQGAVDLGEVVARLREVGYQGWVVVEQDRLPGGGPALDDAVRSRGHLRQLGI